MFCSFSLQLVATNMIAEGRIWDGVQLLCLIDKVHDACKYLQSDNQWDSSLWLAKCRLPVKASYSPSIGFIQPAWQIRTFRRFTFSSL